MLPDFNVDKRQDTIKQLVTKIDNKEIILGKIKIVDRFFYGKSEIIESILIGVPLPYINLIQERNGILKTDNAILSIINSFLKNEFNLMLSSYNDLHNKYYSDLDVSIQTKLTDTKIHYNVLKPNNDLIELVARINNLNVINVWLTTHDFK